MHDAYRTIQSPAEGVYRSKGSRFLAFGFPVKNEEEIRDILSGLRKTYHDARHHGYAYRLGTGNDLSRMNDDGKPSGTAGKPIYGQLLTHDLYNILVVVVRYFGGILLGTSGLIVAYRSAAADMISKASIVERTVEVKLEIRFPYAVLNRVMKILKEEKIVPAEPEIDTACSMFLLVREGYAGQLSDRLLAIPGLNLKSFGISD